MVVVLTWPEFTLAAIVGVLRHISALKHARPDTDGSQYGNHWIMHVEGACAEMALAKSQGRYWHALAPVIREIPSDVEGGSQVRSTERLDGCLIVHPEDKDEHTFYLLVGTAPKFTIVGSMLAKDAKQERFWRSNGVRNPAFFVPQQHLTPVGVG